MPILRTFLSSLLPRKSAPAPAATGGLGDEVARLAAEGAVWLRAKASAGDVFAALDAALAGEPAPSPETEERDARLAALIGETIRAELKGRWVEDPLLGLVLHEVGIVPLTRLVPLGVLESRWRVPGWSFASFKASLPARLDDENQHLMYLQMPAHSPGRILADVLESGDARAQAEGFRRFWLDRFKAELPLSLAGVARVEAFLRTHFAVFALHEETLIQAGFFLGEVARGLYGGEWELAGLTDVTKAALVHPELPLYPVGKIFKFITTRPEADGLEEFVRVISSARAAMRGSGGGAAT